MFLIIQYRSNVGVVDVFLMKDLATGGPRQPTPKVSLDNLLTSISFIKFNHDSQVIFFVSFYTAYLY